MTINAANIDDGRTTRHESGMVRLTMDPTRRGHGALDGAWWPHSQILATELPALIIELDAWLGQTARRAPISDVSISLTTWPGAPKHLDVAGRRVAVTWFGAIDANTISISCPDDTHLDLLVVPPGAPAEAAATVMAVAADPANTLHGSMLLASVVPRVLSDNASTGAWNQPTGGPAIAAWDTDGGSVVA